MAVPGKKLSTTRRNLVKNDDSNSSDLGDWDSDSISSSEKSIEAPQAEGRKPAEDRKPPMTTTHSRRKEVARADSDKSEPHIPAAMPTVPQSVAVDGVKYRSPILCIMGHVDTGKTKLLDRMRHTNVGEREAGNITQQIGATFFPRENLLAECIKVDSKVDLKVPGLLIIDTPGHASFSNLRSRGSSLCDLAILVVDIMHGLEPQTKESIALLRKRKCPFIVALNKIDRLYNWQPYKAQGSNKTVEASAGSDSGWSGFLKTIKSQKRSVKEQFQDRASKCILQLTEDQGLNFSLYYENNDPRRTVSVVPTSAITGEGIPDMLAIIVKLTQTLMGKKITLDETEVECSVLEVKAVEGLGTTIDVILVGGVLHEGDTIVVCGMNGPIVTTIRALLTPQPMRELRVKGEYVRHKQISAAMGLKISAPNLETAVAGTSVKVVKNPNDSALIEKLSDEVQGDMSSIFDTIDKTSDGVYVMASTLGSLEALLDFLKQSEIPVNGVNIGTVHKLDIVKASTMRERGHAEYAVVLAFDIKVDPEADVLAKELGVLIFTADVIYHLFDKFTKHLEEFREQAKLSKAKEAVFPCILQMLPNCIFNKKDPLIFGVKVEDGVLQVGTPLIIPSKLPVGATNAPTPSVSAGPIAMAESKPQGLRLGTVESIEYLKKSVTSAKQGLEVCIKIAGDSNITYGRHFDHKDKIVSHISRQSIDVMKTHFKTELQEHVKLVVHLKRVLGIL